MRLKKFIKIEILTAFMLLAVFSTINFASAGDFLKDNVRTNISKGTQDVGTTAGYEPGHDDSALILVQTLISFFLGVIGVLLLVYIVYAGYNWMTAQGDEEKVEKAKDTIKRAIIGVIIIVGAYAISMFVMSGIEVGTLREAGSSGGVGGFTTPSQ